MTNPRLETWGPFGRGWTNDKFYSRVTGRVAFSVIGYPQAWTSGTNGLVTSEVVCVKIDSETDYATYRGKIVMPAPMRAVTPHFELLGTRRRDDELARMEAAPMPAPQAQPVPRGMAAAPITAQDSARLRQHEATRLAQATAARHQAFIVNEHVATVLEPGRGDGGTVFTDNGQSRNPKTPYGTPLTMLAIKHYGRILRNLEKGLPVQMELDVKNCFDANDLNSFNIIAEIPGTDARFKDEV